METGGKLEVAVTYRAHAFQDFGYFFRRHSRSPNFTNDYAGSLRPAARIVKNAQTLLNSRRTAYASSFMPKPSGVKT
jgi:hypothetical protein